LGDRFFRIAQIIFPKNQLTKSELLLFVKLDKDLTLEEFTKKVRDEEERIGVENPTTIVLDDEPDLTIKVEANFEFLLYGKTKQIKF